MRDCQPATACCQPRRRLHQATLIACEPWEPPKIRTRGGSRAALLRAFGKELWTDRIACDKSPPPEVAHRRLEGHRGRTHHPRQHAVREPRHRVLLEQQRRDPPRRGEREHRPRAVAPDPDHEVRPSPRQDPPRVERAQRQQRQPAHQRRARHPLESRAPQHVELEAFARHHARLDAARRARERDHRVRTAAQQLARHRDPRVEMPAGPSPGDHDPQRCHASAVGSAVVTTCALDACCDTLSRMPTPIRLISSDDPP